MMTKPRAIFCTVFFGVLLGPVQPVAAQSSSGNAVSGHRYALNWCSGCHSFEPNSVGMFAADFAEIANLTSTTELSLKVFLRTSHKNMPNFILQPDEADDIGAYILSLKKK